MLYRFTFLSLGLLALTGCAGGGGSTGEDSDGLVFDDETSDIMTDGAGSLGGPSSAAENANGGDGVCGLKDGDEDCEEEGLPSGGPESFPLLGSSHGGSPLHD